MSMTQRKKPQIRRPRPADGAHAGPCQRDQPRPRVLAHEAVLQRRPRRGQPGRARSPRARRRPHAHALDAPSRRDPDRAPGRAQPGASPARRRRGRPTRGRHRVGRAGAGELAGAVPTPCLVRFAGESSVRPSLFFFVSQEEPLLQVSPPELQRQGSGWCRSCASSGRRASRTCLCTRARRTRASAGARGSASRRTSSSDAHASTRRLTTPGWRPR